jgi:hypothetical protein
MSLRQNDGRLITTPGPRARPALRDPNGLDIPLITQADIRFCWAACIEMMLAFAGNDISQLDIAMRLFGRPSLQELWESQVAEAWHVWQYWSTFHPNPVSFDAIIENLNDNAAVQAGLDLYGQGHLVLIKNVRGNGALEINDPALRLPPTCSYTELITTWNWRRSWTDIKHW